MLFKMLLKISLQVWKHLAVSIIEKYFPVPDTVRFLLRLNFTIFSNFLSITLLLQLLTLGNRIDISMGTVI